MDKLTAEKLIDKTRDDYNLIADQFASTRHYNWGDFATALASIPLQKGAKVLDLGCGNGRAYELLKEHEVDYYGLDLSKELIRHAEMNVPKGHFLVGDMLQTPYKDNEFDLVISMATLHHIPGKTARKQALDEIYRITKPEGNIIITIWYFWNDRRYLKDIIKALPQILVGRHNFDPGDFLLNWRKGDGTTLTTRYFHAWRKSELVSAFKKSGFKSIYASFYPGRNKKISSNLIVTALKPK